MTENEKGCWQNDISEPAEDFGKRSQICINRTARISAAGCEAEIVADWCSKNNRMYVK
jgi:hypothetical protein